VRVTSPQHHWNHLAKVVQSLAIEFLHQPVKDVCRRQNGDQIELVIQGFQRLGEQLNFCLAARSPATYPQILRAKMSPLQNAEAWVDTQIPTVLPGERMHWGSALRLPDSQQYFKKRVALML
jgi:hypothetical protein